MILTAPSQLGALALALASLALGASTAQAAPDWYQPDSSGEITQGANRQAHGGSAPIVVVKSEQSAPVTGGAFCGAGTGYPDVPNMTKITGSGGTCFYSTSLAGSTTLASGLEVSGLDLSPANLEKAQASCQKYIALGKNDWVLPSSDELLEISNSKDNIGGFKEAVYWTRTDVPGSSVFAVNVSLGRKITQYVGTTSGVRCVRR